MPPDPARPAEVGRALAWLHAEQNAAQTPHHAAALHHEAAVLYEGQLDDVAAKRNYQAAASLTDFFREPLTALLTFAEKHGQLDELRELYSKLVAHSPNELERQHALLEATTYALEQSADLDGAESALRTTLRGEPEDATPWLLLQVIGIRKGDLALQREALLAQAALTSNSNVRARIYIDAADIAQRTEDPAAAIELLTQASAIESDFRLVALDAAIRAAIRLGQSDALIKLLERKVDLLELAESEPAQAYPIASSERHPGALAHAHLLLAHLLGGSDSAAAKRHLVAAQSRIPSDPLLLQLGFAQAEATSDTQQFLKLGVELAQSVSGDYAAWCWFKLATNRLHATDLGQAKYFVQRGLAQADSSVPLRVLSVQLALLSSDGLELAEAITQVTRCLATEEAQVSWQLAAAAIWALRVHHAPASRQALASAVQRGLPPAAQHFIGRLLALWVGELGDYAVHTEAAINPGSERLERLDLSLELVRTRLALKCYGEVPRVIDGLTQQDDTAAIGHIAEFVIGRWLQQNLAETGDGSQASDDEGPSARETEAHPSIDFAARESRCLRYLADSATSPSLAAAFHSLLALSDIRAGNASDALERFRGLSTADPTNLTWAMAQVALLLRDRANTDALRVLRNVAEASDDRTLRATVALYGAILGTSVGEVAEVSALLDVATSSHPKSAGVFARWLLRTVATGNLPLQARVLEAARGLGSPILRGLQRLGLYLVATPEETLALGPLPEFPLDAGNDSSDSLRLAAELGNLLWGKQHFQGQSQPANEVPPFSELRAALDYATRWFPEGRDGDLDARLEQARALAQEDLSLLAQIEWLLVARQRGDALEEAQARAEVARHVPPKEAELLRVSVQQLSYLAGEQSCPLLPSTSAAARYANLEVSPAGSDPRRRAVALEEAADLQGPGSTWVMRVSVGFNRLASGEFKQARAIFHELVETRPRFLPAWLGLKCIAEMTEDDGLLAEACAALGDLLTVPSEASSEWERAATVLLDRLGDTPRGRFALARAVALDIGREASFSRLFRMVREAGESSELLALIEARLPHATTDDERIRLLWERARTLRTLGDKQGALQALEAVSRMAPNHVGALALAGEIHIALSQFDQAVVYLSQLGRSEEAPLKQRLMGALAAADLFDKKLGRPAFARDILLELHRLGHSTLAVKERLTQIALRLSALPLALELLGQLLVERPSAEGRTQAARLVLTVCRDSGSVGETARQAVTLLLTVDPADPEAVDWILSGKFEADQAREWLEVAAHTLRNRLAQEPLAPEALTRLARIAAFFDDIRTRQACLSSLIALGAGTLEMDLEIQSIDVRMQRVPTIALDDIALEAVAADDDKGPLAELFAQFAPTIAEALGPSLAALGVGKKQRIDPRAGLPLRNEIAAWAGAFGVKEFDLYVAPEASFDVIAVPTERPSLVVSSQLGSPLTLAGRQAVARELFALRRGTCILRHRSVHEVSALIVAACNIGEHPIAAPAYAMTDEFQRLLSHALSRKLRKDLMQHASSIAGSESDPASWITAAHHSMDRVAVLATGDVAEVLAHLTGQRGRLGTTIELRERTSRLIAFATSTSYLDLKDTLGLSVR